MSDKDTKPTGNALRELLLVMYYYGKDNVSLPDSRLDKKVQAIIDLFIACLPKDDIDEEISAQYDLVIPQGLHGYRAAIDIATKNIKGLGVGK